MVKKFVIFFAVFAVLAIVLNFSFASASISGAGKIRVLSLVIIISTLEIAVFWGTSFSFANSAKNYSKKEAIRSFALNSMDDGVVIYNGSHLVLYMNSKAEEFLGVKYEEVSDVPLNPDFSLRNPKLSKIVGAVFFSKPEPEYDRFFIKESEINLGREKVFAKTLKPKGLMQFQQ